MDTTFIYGLVDPRTQIVRYIGKANNPEKRFYHHLKERYRSRKCSWVQSLISQSLEPRLVYIERIPASEWQERERYWIAFYRAQGEGLLNDTDGGDGVHGMRHSIEARARIGAAAKGNQYGRGYKLTPEQRARKSAALRGHSVGDETRAKIAATKIGKPRSPEVRAKLSAALKGRPITDKQRAARVGRKLSDAHKAHIRSALRRCTQHQRAYRIAGCTQPELPFTS